MRFFALDGLRGIAALMVALFHLPFLNHVHSLSIVRNSYLFVDFFFVLSGFVIAHTYRDRLSSTFELKNFMIRRFARLWPLHMAMLLAITLLFTIRAILIKMGFPIDDASDYYIIYTRDTWLANIFFLHSLGIFKHISWNYPSWSISVEFFTYMLFAFACMYCRRHIGKFAALIVLSSALILVAFASHGINTTFDMGIFRCILGFFTGFLTHSAYLKLRRSNFKLPFPNMLEVISMSSALLFVHFANTSMLSFLAPLVFAFPTLVFAESGGRISQILHTRSMQALGTLSFSIYLLHALPLFVIHSTFRLLEAILHRPFVSQVPLDGVTWDVITTGNVWVMDAGTILYLSVIIVLAKFTYRHIEMPAQDTINAYAKKKALPSGLQS